VTHIYSKKDVHKYTKRHENKEWDFLKKYNRSLTYMTTYSFLLALQKINYYFFIIVSEEMLNLKAFSGEGKMYTHTDTHFFNFIKNIKIL
jgi:hypothetical protein